MRVKQQQRRKVKHDKQDLSIYLSSYKITCFANPGILLKNIIHGLMQLFHTSVIPLNYTSIIQAAFGLNPNST
jgi:hypothetical protein